MILRRDRSLGDVNVNAIAPASGRSGRHGAGLAVAIPALFAYNWLNTRIKSISADNRVFVDEFVTLLANSTAERGACQVRSTMAKKMSMTTSTSHHAGSGLCADGDLHHHDDGVVQGIKVNLPRPAIRPDRETADQGDHHHGRWNMYLTLSRESDRARESPPQYKAANRICR